MNTFLKLLPMELEQLGEDEYLEPLSPVPPKSRVVGEAPDYIRQLYTLWQRKERSAKEFKIEVEYARTRETALSYMGQACECHAKAEVVRDLFWIALNDTFGLWSTPSVYICHGWQIACSDEHGPTKTTLRDFMGRFFNAVDEDEDDD